METETTIADAGSPRHRRLRSTRRLRQFMMTVGVTGLALGLVLCVLSLARDSHGTWVMGLWYVLGGMVVLGLRQVIAALDRIRKRKYRKR